MKPHSVLLLAPLLAVTGCGGAGGQKSLAGTYNIEQDGYGFGPGAEKIILSLRSDGTFDVKAGPIVMLEGTWEAQAGRLTFSKGQGSLVTSYRAEGDKLIPLKEGKDVTFWRWNRQS